MAKEEVERAAKTAGFSPMTKKSIPSFKVIITSPYQLKWPELNRDVAADFTERIVRAFTNIRLPAAKIKAGSKREESQRKRSHSQRHSSPSFAAPSREDEVVPYNKEKRDQIVIGLNAVTRGLERDRLRAVVVCLSARPAAMNHHLLMLAASRTCPAVALPDMSKTLAPLLGVTSALALGFRKLLEGEDDYFADLVAHISTTAPIISIPWLTTPVNTHSQHTSTGDQPTDGDDGKTEATSLDTCVSAVATAEQKRKWRSDVDEGYRDVYVPLQVKTMIIKSKKQK